MLAAGPGGKATTEGIERQLFGNRNLLGQQVLPDLLAACAGVSDAMPDLLGEMDVATGFSEALLGRRSRSQEKLIAVYATLIAHGMVWTRSR